MSFIVRGLSSLLGTVLPCFYSYKAMKKPTNPKLTHWLQYWTVYGSFSALDWIANTFFISCFIPFYDLFVLMFIIYLSIPHFGGPAFVYKKILAPFLRRKERQVDNFLGKCFSAFWTNAPTLLSNAFNGLVNMIGEPTTPEVMFSQDLVTARSVSDSKLLQNMASYFAPKPAMKDSVEIQEESDGDELVPGANFTERRRVLQYDTDETDEFEAVASTVVVKEEIEDDYESGDEVQIIEEQPKKTRVVRARRQATASAVPPEAPVARRETRGKPATRRGRGAARKTKEIKIED